MHDIVTVNIVFSSLLSSNDQTMINRVFYINLTEEIWE